MCFYSARQKVFQVSQFFKNCKSSKMFYMSGCARPIRYSLTALYMCTCISTSAPASRSVGKLNSNKRLSSSVSGRRVSGTVTELSLPARPWPASRSMPYSSMSGCNKREREKRKSYLKPAVNRTWPVRTRKRGRYKLLSRDFCLTSDDHYFIIYFIIYRSIFGLLISAKNNKVVSGITFSLKNLFAYWLFVCLFVFLFFFVFSVCNMGDMVKESRCQSWLDFVLLIPTTDSLKARDTIGNNCIHTWCISTYAQNYKPVKMSTQ